MNYLKNLNLKYKFGAVALAFLTLFGINQVTAQSLGGGNSTIDNLNQWKATTTPIRAITQRIKDLPLLITGLDTGECLTLSSDRLATTTPCGSGLSSLSSLDSSISIGGTLTDPTVDINLSNPNTWTAEQGNTSIFRNNAGIDWSANNVTLASAGTDGGGAWIGFQWNHTDSRVYLQDELGALFDLGVDTLYANDSIVSNQITTNEFIGSTIKATGSGGLLFESNSGTDVALFGAGGGAGSTFYGGVNIEGGLQVTNTTEQLRLAYDSSNYVTQTVSSAGLLSWQTTAGATAGVYTLTPHGAGGAGTNRTLSFGTAWGNAALWLYNAGAGSRYGWGMNANQMQFFSPSVTGDSVTFNKGGDLQASNANEYFRFQQYAGSTGAGMAMGNVAYAPVTPHRIDFQGVSATAGTAGVENILRFSRTQTGGVSYPEAFAIGIGRYSSSGLGPDTRVDFSLKSIAATDYTTDAGIMSLNSNKRVLVGNVGAAASTLHIFSSTSGSGSSAFRIHSAGSADRLVYRDDGRLWLGTGTPSYNALLSLDTSGTQTEIQFTTNATGRTSTDGAYLMYSDSIGFRYLNMENQPHVFYISGSEVARFSNTGAIMQVTGTLAAQYSGGGSSRGGAISLISTAGTAQDWIMATAGNDNSVVNGRSWFLYDNSSSTARFFVDKNGNVGVGLGSNAATARFHARSTSYFNFRGDYDASNYWTASTTSTGITTFDAVGSSNAFSFSDNVGFGTSTPSQAIDVNGGVRLDTSTAQPTCTSTTRGTFWFVKNGAGVKDQVEVCAKDTGDAYAWRVIY